MAGLDRDDLVSGLVRVAELMVSGENQGEVDAHFVPVIGGVF